MSYVEILLLKLVRITAYIEKLKLIQRVCPSSGFDGVMAQAKTVQPEFEILCCKNVIFFNAFI
jgi:hypothetical protein